MHPNTRQHNSARRVGRARQVAIMAASVGFVGAAAIVGTPPAHAAAPPTLRVGLYNGPDDWTGWQSSVDTKNNRDCRMRVAAPPAAKLNRNAPISGKGNYAWPQNFIPAGQYRLQVVCPTASSPAISFYSPRSPFNDARTMFSNYTRGVFGI